VDGEIFSFGGRRTFTLDVQGVTEKIALQDVLIGDVWLCSGQSNMEWTVKQADNFSNEKRMLITRKFVIFLWNMK
jgi:hypothetical protein